ncbi:AP2/ERF and B3 domain-containing transcription factor At1g51120-like [Magnolia sinica]|uniref:AP2/ERF and B3 domain-containing transcription factor At1g51120-like n=1 Tax=Magnolia sinica TaxID=86752 RepID=UPI00265A75E9|nr:AP2/ERF and B3 domain-containing transcription factor At1g51120-like [Magnolia sinica]
MEGLVVRKKTSMDEEMVSMISNAAMAAEGSDSNSNNNPIRPIKRTRHDNSDTSVRFKGVVLQQNGHWGAQIYANHQRIWLGTFKSEKSAAMAYDSAAIKLRSGDSHRNFPWTSLTIQEPKFQDLYTTDAVLNMIKDGSYESKFADFICTQTSNMTKDVNFDLRDIPAEQGGMLYRQLFQKELTPSDVGKLNRLVIPKKHAMKYFPQLPEDIREGDESGSGIDDVQLVFFDDSLRSWKFRYCYWKSSQSYVFTRGWNRFVKEKKLKAKDVVTFYRCEYRERLMDEKAFCMIRVEHGGGGDGGGGDEETPKVVVGKVELQLGLGGWSGCGSVGEGRKVDGEKEEFVKKKGVRLFGVQIS